MEVIQSFELGVRIVLMFICVAWFGKHWND